MALETPSVAQGTTNRIKENKTKKKNKRKDEGNKKTKGKNSRCLVMLQFTSQQLNIAPDV